MDRVRTRYAPSPTGHLHIGGARTALFSYLHAKRNGGDFIVRIEDTDTERNVEGADEKQMAMLKWLGIEWDEGVDVGGPYGPYRCMERTEIYNRYIDQLLKEGKAYLSYTTKEELEKEREEQIARGEVPKYSGWDRDLTPEQRAKFEAEGRVPSVRFRVPEGKTIVIEDEIRGTVQFESDGIGDFVIRRPDGRPTYNFAVVVDDALMKISHVIRGEEHLSNTPKQIMIYEALGFKPPVFAHIPLILNGEGKKMSKRDESIIQFIDQYKELGYLPEAIVNFISLLGWSPEGEEEMFTPQELVEVFSLERVSKAPAIFDTGKLKWMNGQYIKKASLERVVELAIPHLEKAGRIRTPLDEEQKAWVTRLVALYQEQMEYAAEIVELSDLFFQDEINYSEQARQVLAEEQVPAVLKAFLEQVQQSGSFEPDDIKKMFKQVQKETGYKGKKLFMPVRVAVTGLEHGPDLRGSLSLIGRDRVIKRLHQVIDNVL
ncbi:MULTISPECIES: glutamate--tRNA ligase [Thermoactinomyces]|jgi:nondiscriminating glutamyl-tRNA synthetase|uniref:glutamate--tRNA ligase n=1 Tax=Thermoactinomyces TaxID=2023 RepID=UPI0007A0CC5F|nr:MULTISPECIES: glutamate--tRNA ligase [Thermoactinomyces]KYQ85825.1 glutamate--tRNA ligase [Thermoactinomyces sp. AS95]MBH8586840.1 glutamate--tRNA ligase [Thermoactinomyces sp. CICC 10520]MBI0387961.1 glutamate--tRNA ligase [Thermoactinomyces sp. CICC 24227]MCF6135847.1 glutamate--tRNA ligase [Thermoactinomyces vulgaris]QCV54226.1 glutamate--tRNA ligase [Thermoactinomyces vulgaris]